MSTDPKDLVHPEFSEEFLELLRNSFVVREVTPGPAKESDLVFSATAPLVITEAELIRNLKTDGDA